MLAIDTKGALVLVEQFRKPRAERTLELPGGVVREGETPQEAAIREFSEETGLNGGKAQFLFTLDLDLSTTLHRTHVFTSKTRDSDAARDAEFQVRRLQINDALRMIQDGTITHAPTVAATLALALDINQGELRGRPIY
nr:NUDIX hydrolase [Novosphingobium hassiacum]